VAHRWRGALAATLAAVAAVAVVGGPMAHEAHAQTTIAVPGTSGDQLIFFYDARTGRVPFLSVANPGGTPVVIEVAFYPQDLQSRLGEAVFTLAGGGNVVIDPTQSSVAGGVASGNAGLAVVTPIASATDSHAIVPPVPLTGGYTLANQTLEAAFGENPYGRLAVTNNGSRATAGAQVDGNAVKYQRFTPSVLMVPVYYNPQTLAPPADDGNRVIVAAFTDSYGAQFDIGPASDTPPATFCNAGGFEVATGAPEVNGVLLTDLQAIAGAATLSGSGKLFLDVNAGNGNEFGIYSQSLGTFAAGQRMPAIDSVPACPQPTPAPSGGTPTPTPTSTAGGGEGCTTTNETGTINVSFDTAGGSVVVNGIVATIGYPGAALDIPGTNNDPTVVAAVANLTGASDGIFSVGDQDSNSDGQDDTLSVGLVRINQTNSLPSGAFARVTFTRRAGQACAAASDFTCTADVTDFNGSTVAASCSVTVP
jgi:hypothetical protein